MQPADWVAELVAMGLRYHRTRCGRLALPAYQVAQWRKEEFEVASEEEAVVWNVEGVILPWVVQYSVEAEELLGVFVEAPGSLMVVEEEPRALVEVRSLLFETMVELEGALEEKSQTMTVLVQVWVGVALALRWKERCSPETTLRTEVWVVGH